MPKYLPFIDGLRALAVLSVFAFHLNHSYLPAGFLGVDIFFVISGFLITMIILNEMKNGHFSFANFYARRVKRILPAFFVISLVICIVGFWLSLPDETSYTFKLLKRSLYFWQNMELANIPYFAPNAESISLLHTWSLAVEEQFYLIFPLMLFVFYKFRFSNKAVVIVCIAILCVSLAITLFPYKGQLNYYWLPSRANELLFGALGAMFVSFILGSGSLESLKNVQDLNSLQNLKNQNLNDFQSQNLNNFQNLQNQNLKNQNQNALQILENLQNQNSKDFKNLQNQNLNSFQNVDNLNNQNLQNFENLQNFQNSENTNAFQNLKISQNLQHALLKLLDSQKFCNAISLLAFVGIIACLVYLPSENFPTPFVAIPCFFTMILLVVNTLGGGADLKDKLRI